MASAPAPRAPSGRRPQSCSAWRHVLRTALVKPAINSAANARASSRNTQLAVVVGPALFGVAELDGEDGIYFDHRGDCQDGDHHKTCSGRSRGVVSLGFDVDRKRIRSKVSGQTKAEVKDKLKALHSELDAHIRITAAAALPQLSPTCASSSRPHRRRDQCLSCYRRSPRPPGAPRPGRRRPPARDRPDVGRGLLLRRARNHHRGTLPGHRVHPDWRRTDRPDLDLRSPDRHRAHVRAERRLRCGRTPLTTS